MTAEPEKNPGIALARELTQRRLRVLDIALRRNLERRLGLQSEKPKARSNSSKVNRTKVPEPA